MKEITVDRIQLKWFYHLCLKYAVEDYRKINKGYSDREQLPGLLANIQLHARALKDMKKQIEEDGPTYTLKGQ